MNLTPAEPSSTSPTSISTPGRIAFATLTGVFACFWGVVLMAAILGRHQDGAKVPGFSALTMGSMTAGILLVYFSSLIGVLVRQRWGWYLTVLLAMFWFMLGVVTGFIVPNGHTPKRSVLVFAAFLIAISASYLVYFWRRSIRQAFAIELPWINLWAWLSAGAGVLGVLAALKHVWPMQILWWTVPVQLGRVTLGFTSVTILAAAIGLIRRTSWGWALAMAVLVCSLINGAVIAAFPHPEMATRLSAMFPHVVVTPEQFRGAWAWSLPWLAFQMLVGIMLLVHRARFVGRGVPLGWHRQ